jgi:hypothetical protein
MELKALLHDIKPGDELMVANQPFTYGGKVTMELDGGDVRYWLFDRDGGMVTVSPDDEEIVSFQTAAEALEPEDEMVTYDGVDYEFSYEDSGTVKAIEGETDMEEGDKYAFADYESGDGELVRIVTNQDTEDVYHYAGSVVVENDISLIE